jgi:hypothetical protein
LAIMLAAVVKALSQIVPGVDRLRRPRPELIEPGQRPQISARRFAAGGR